MVIKADVSLKPLVTAEPNPLLLPVATTAQVPLTTAYDALDVPSMAAGDYYYDPTTNVKIWKLTSATYPATSANWGHDYAEGGDEVSLPYNGTTRAVLIRQDGGAWWLLDFTPGSGPSNPRELTGSLKPSIDVGFTFSNNAATPHYAFMCTGGNAVRRININTLAEASGDGWPVTSETGPIWLHQAENDSFFVWMRGNTGYIVGYEPSTETMKAFYDAGINEPRIDRAGRYVGISNESPVSGRMWLWDWQTDEIVWLSGLYPGIPTVSEFPFAHIASLRRRWYGVAWNDEYPCEFYRTISETEDSDVRIGGPANGTLVHGSGNWIQYPADLGDQWALMNHYGSLRPSPTETAWLAPGHMVFITENGERRTFAHCYNTTADYALLSFAKLSSDGKYVLFTSDMNNSGRSDVFLAEVPLG